MRTIESLQIQIQRGNSGNLIIGIDANHPWENQSVSNAACTLITNPEEIKIVAAKLPFDEATRKRLLDYPAMCAVIYTATGTGTDENNPSLPSLGLAILGPEFELIARHHAPVISPDQEYDIRGISSGRLVRIGRRYTLTYNALSGQADAAACRIALASTTDFTTWIKHGLLRGNFNHANSMNAAMVEKKIGSKYIMFHQPMSGSEAGTIHWAETTDVYRDWKTRGLLMRPMAGTSAGRNMLITGAPPVKLADGRFLLLYGVRAQDPNGPTSDSLGIAIGDPGSRYFIVKRFEPLRIPRNDGNSGDTPAAGTGRTHSICGAYMYEGHLYFLYSDGGKSISGARIPRDQIAQFTSR